MLFTAVVWEEQKGALHLLPLPLCCARLRGCAVSRYHVENSQEMSTPAPISLYVDPKAEIKLPPIPHKEKEVPTVEFVVF